MWEQVKVSLYMLGAFFVFMALFMGAVYITKIH